MLSQEDGSLGKDPCRQAPGPDSGAHIEREKNQHSQIVLWPPYEHWGVLACIHMHKHSHK